MPDSGLIPPGLRYLIENIKSRDNLLGISKAAGARWAQDLKLPRSGETIFFAGCGYQFDSKLESLLGLLRKMDKSALGSEKAIGLAGFQQKLGLDGMMLKVLGRGGDNDGEPLRDAVRVLRRLGMNPGYLAEDEPCCGGLLHYSGLRAEFVARAGEVYSNLKSCGVKRIIGLVPSCTYTLRHLLAEAVSGYDLEIKHFTEVVSENLSSLRLRFPGAVKVAYHDPCQLARYLQIVDEPRKILKAIEGIELVEPAWTKGEWATCCGGGGGFEAVFPEMSEMLALNRVKELLETGADIIATSCPGCIMQLRSGLKAAKADRVEVMDLAHIVAISMEER